MTSSSSCGVSVTGGTPLEVYLQNLVRVGGDRVDTGPQERAGGDGRRRSAKELPSGRVGRLRFIDCLVIRSIRPVDVHIRHRKTLTVDNYNLRQ